MKNYFSIANNILTGSLRPWAKENQDEEKFRHLLSQKLRQYKDNPPLFCQKAVAAIKASNIATENKNLEELTELASVEVRGPIKIDIPSFFNKQTEFFSYLISNIFQCIISGTRKTINDSDEIDGTYKLFQLFNKLESIISTFNTIEDSSKATNLIISTLGIHLFAAYRILVSEFDTLINFEVLSENEVLFLLCPGFEYQKSDKSKLAFYLNSYISKQEETLKELSNYEANEQKPIIVKSQNTQKTKFSPILDDNRPLKKGIALFHDLIRNPKSFGLFEEKLFLNDYINETYSFCGKHGYKNQLAIIYHLLIEKNYFKKFNDTTKKRITSRDIVKFLNHRYDIDIDKQFRSYKNKPEERAKFIESMHWMYQLPVC